MLTIEDILAPENQEAAVTHFATKRPSRGPDGMSTGELPDYWKTNGERICEEIRQGIYRPGFARTFEHIGSNGKKRNLASLNAIDRLTERMLQQQLQTSLEPVLSEYCYAYRSGKGPLPAAVYARENVSEGRIWLCEIDIKDYFERINHQVLLAAAEPFVDKETLRLTELYIGRQVMRNGRLKKNQRGVLQGAPASPSLANLYLNDLDHRLDESGLKWMRFADNIYVFTERESEAAAAYNSLTDILQNSFSLMPNERKSGIYKTLDRRILGYELHETESGAIDLRRHSYRPVSKYSNWHRSVAYESRHEYHIVEDGILNKRDYSLLFENEDEKHHIPVEVVDQLNIYGEVTVAPQALTTLSAKGIRLVYFNKHGNMQGVFTPPSHGKSTELLLRQCELYANDDLRCQLAQEMENANIENMLAVLRYYRQRRQIPGFCNAVDAIDAISREIADAADVDTLMLIEARARQAYYKAFDDILTAPGMKFETRSRRPPKNEINAMISFGNTLLYNKVLQDIWKTSLDPKIGIVHATGRRDYSLNLDIADIFKPIIVDRTIFSLVNRREIRPEDHFVRLEDGSVLLNKEGKRKMIYAFEKKLHSTTRRRGSEVAYRRLISNEVDKLRAMFADGAPYKAYKHY